MSKSKSNSGAPGNLSNFGAHGQPRQQLRHAMIVQEVEATGTVHFSTKRSRCTTTVSWSSCSTRTRLSQAPSRPLWSASPKARKTSGDLCVQRTAGLPQTTQAQQSHVFGGLTRLCNKAAKRRPRLAREFVPSAVRGDSNLVNYRLPGGAADAACGLLAALGPWLRSQGLLWLP